MEHVDYAYSPSRGPSRSECVRQGREAVAILEDGGYEAPSGRRVDVRASVDRAVSATHDYRPEEAIGAPAVRCAKTRIRVVNGTSLASAREMAARGPAPLVLNFASAKSPGGGFLDGARAQEESLARCSALYACLTKSGMYAHHRASGDAIYSDWMIHSPDVPVFRDDESAELLEQPYLCSFLTAPAPNAGVVLERDPSRADEVTRVMIARVRRALAICATKGHRQLVLGAWGCGVFGNDATVVARAFAAELEGAHAGVFEEIVFAVLDWSEERRYLRPFVEQFAA